jgi:tRNA(Arg) A34 adenosine deaminase TadA
MHKQSLKGVLEKNEEWTHDPSRRLWLKQAVGLSLAGTLGIGLLESAWPKQRQAAHPSFNEEEAKTFMSRAIELARKGMRARAGGPFAAVIVKDGKLVGEDYNQVYANHDPTAHGEVMAIRDACKRAKTISLEGCDLYTTGEPCPMCLSAAYWAKISRIFYGFSNQDAATAGFPGGEYQFNEFNKPTGERKISEMQVMRTEAFQLTKEFAVRSNRVR